MEEMPESEGWRPERLRIRPAHLALSWVLSALSLLLAAWILPGVSVTGIEGALVAAAAIGVLNALVPPLLAALRLPATVLVGFLLLLFADAAIIELAAAITNNAIAVSGFDQALLTALISATFTTVAGVVIGVDDNDAYTLRVTRRIARRQGGAAHTQVPGILYLEIDGLSLPTLRRAMQDGSAPNMAGWLRSGGHQLIEWETDLSSQTGASQAGILLGSNEDIPAFRWVEKETGAVVSCSSPRDCAEIERRRITGIGLLRDGGTSRGNLLSGEADEQILTASRVSAELGSNPGYRSFLANGYNVTRCLVLFAWEVAIEVTAAARQRRRGVVPRGHRGGKYPLLRAGMCVLLPELIVHAVLSDMMRGRPAVYATFASYDEVAHHSGRERSDTMEALRKLDRQFGRIDRARAFAPRPYEIVVLSDHGQTQGATFRQRNGYGLDDLVERSLEKTSVVAIAAGDADQGVVANALEDATGRASKEASPNAGQIERSGAKAVALASGNLGLVYLMEEKRRLTLEEIEDRHPRLLPALLEHPDLGWVMVHSSSDGAVVLGSEGRIVLASGTVEGANPLAPFSPNAAAHLLRSDGFGNAADITVGSFYDSELQEGCAFEELISFHGGLGGPQTRPFILHPVRLPAPQHDLVGAEAVHGLLASWRALLQGPTSTPPEIAATAA
jgi:uncharacterized membrane protein YvlD (DUF360 family)